MNNLFTSPLLRVVVAFLIICLGAATSIEASRFTVREQSLTSRTPQSDPDCGFDSNGLCTCTNYCCSELPQYLPQPQVGEYLPGVLTLCHSLRDVGTPNTVLNLLGFKGCFNCAGVASNSCTHCNLCTEPSDLQCLPVAYPQATLDPTPVSPETIVNSALTFINIILTVIAIWQTLRPRIQVQATLPGFSIISPICILLNIGLAMHFIVRRHSSHRVYALAYFVNALTIVLSTDHPARGPLRTLAALFVTTLFYFRTTILQTAEPQATLETPSWLRNELHVAAYKTLPLDSKARTSKTQFNKHFYKHCSVCDCNVFGYLHEERCRPVVLVQASLEEDHCYQYYTASELGPKPLVRDVLMQDDFDPFIYGTLSEVETGLYHFEPEDDPNDDHSYFHRIVENLMIFAKCPGSRLGSAPRPSPVPITTFTRSQQGSTTDDSINGEGLGVRVSRIRNDVRHIEDKLEQLWPIIADILTRIKVVQGATGGITPGTTTPAPTGSAAAIALTNVAPSTVMPGFDLTPMGNGNFPATVEGQIARILFNMRHAANATSSDFQATLEVTRDVADRWVRGDLIPIAQATLSGMPSISPIVSPQLDGNRDYQLGPNWFMALSTRYYDASRSRLAVSENTHMINSQHMTSNPSCVFATKAQIASLVSSTTGTVIPPTPNNANTAILNRIDPRMDAVNRNVQLIVRLLESNKAVIVQATLGDATLTIADTDQILEPPKSTTLADTPIEEQLNELDTWNVKNVLSRPTLVEHYLWDSDGRGSTVISAQFPNKWLSNIGQNLHFNNMLNAFTMMKANVVFRLVTNTTPMYGGILAMGFDFYGRLHRRGGGRLDPTTVSNCDPIYLDISEGTVAEITVPFSAVSQYLSRQHAPFASQFMGTVFIHTMSNLYRPDGAPPVEVRLYAYVENPAVAVIQDPDNRAYAVPQASIVKTITSFAHSFIPKMQDVYPLALEDGYTVPRTASCRVENIGGVFGLIRTAQWTTATARDAELMEFRVHPMEHDTVSTGATTSILAPRLAHLGRHFSYWNGTLEYRIEVACSKSHAGKLYIVFNPGPAYNGRPGAVETNAHILLDVQLNHELTFTVPFASPTPWKPTYLSHIFGDIDSTCTGRVKIISADGIKSALTPNSTITVNIYARCLPDFQYAVPRNGLQGNSTYGEVVAQVSLTSIRPSLKMNSEDFNDLYKVMRRFTPFVPTINIERSRSIIIPVRPIIPGNVGSHSASSLASGFAFWKGSLSYKFKVLAANGNRSAFEVFHIPTMGIPEGIANTYFTTIAPPTNVNDRTVTGSFLGSQTFHGDIDKEWEVTVPYYSMYDHLHMPLDPYVGASADVKLPILSTNNGCLVIRPVRGAGDDTNRNYSLAVSISCGSDFTLLAPTAFPPIPITGNARTNFRVVPQAQLDAQPQGLFDMYAQLQTILEKVEKLTTRLDDETTESAQAFISNALAETVKTLLIQGKLYLSGWLENILPDVDWKLIASTVVSMVLVYYLRDQIKSSIGSLLLGALATLVSHKVLSKLSEFVQTFMGPQIRVQVGAGLDIPTITQLLCGVVAVLLNMDFKKGISGFIKNLGDMGKNVSGVKSGVEAVKIFSAFVAENIMPSLSSDDRTTLKSVMTDALEVVDEAYTLNLEEMRVKCFSEQAIKDRVIICCDKLHELHKLSIKRGIPPDVSAALRPLIAKMLKLRSEVEAYKGEEGYRIDPFHISVYGKPGIGKSAMMESLNIDLLLFNGFPQSNSTYVRSPENVYWDNYKGQTTTMFDDLGQIAASNPPSDLSELISLKSNAPYMVHMASIAEKGTYFTSRLMISSTNFKLYNDCNFVKEKAALHRRRNILVEMQTADDIEGQPTKADFDRGLSGDNSYAKFRILNSLSAEPESEWMSYDEFTVIACQRSKTYLEGQNALVARQHGSRVASPAIQAILDDERPETIVPVIVVNGEPQVVNAEAQAYLDSLTDSDVRAKVLARWTDHFRVAKSWADYGALTSGLNLPSRNNIATAIQDDSSAGLTGPERVIYHIWKKTEVAQRRSARVIEEGRESLTLVHSYFKSLYNSLPKEKRKVLATGLALTGAIGIGYSLWLSWQRTTSPSGSSNIPVEMFLEVDDSYQSKVRSQPPRKQVVVESGVDDLVSRRGKRSRVVVEAIVPQPSAPTVIVEGSAEFLDWSKKNPGLIPYRFELDNSGWLPRLGPETQAWRDYVAYCEEKGCTNYTIIPESGKDDFVTRQGRRKAMVIEGESVNPMMLDVPEKIYSLSEEDLIRGMTTLNSGEHLDLETVRTDSGVYEMATPQYTTDPECSLFIKSKLVDNTGLIMHKKSQFRMRFLAINDRFIILPKHFFLLTAANWEEGDIFIVWLKGKRYEQSFYRKNLTVSPNRDLSMYLLTARVTGTKSVMNQIADRDTHATFRQTDGSLVAVCREENGTVFINQHHLPVISATTRADHNRVTYPIGNAMHILKGYTYAADTQNGDCGSVLLQHNVRNNAKILGLHVAAITEVTRAFAELVVREEIEDMQARLVETTGYITTGTVLDTISLARKHKVMVQGLQSRQFAHLNDEVDIIDNVPATMQKFTPSKTQIKPSPLQGHIDMVPKTEPAVLTPKDPRCTSGIDPLINTVRGYGLPSKPFRNDHLQLIKEHMIGKLRQYDGYINKRLLSLKEAINGIPDVDYADAINMKSAEGSFWNLSRPFWAHSKEWMFENTEGEGKRPNYRIRYESGLLQKTMHRLMEAQKGRRVLSVSSENLKDERRPLKKTRPPPDATEEELKEFTPNTRSFSILPVDYNLLVREYFWDFSAMIMKHRGKLGPQVGIDPCSMEWTGLMRRLMATSDMGFAGDFKNYDRQTPAEFMDLSCDIINGWYDDGPVNAQVRKVLMGEAFDRLTIVRGVYLHIDKGLPSGFPLTVIVNSLNNDIYKYASWLAITTGIHTSALIKRQPQELVKFIPLDVCDEHTDSAYYGDDNLHAVDPEVSDFFNMQTYGEFLEQHNVMLTDEDKNHWSTAAPLVPMDSVSFLKRLFVPHESGFLLAPLEKRSIEDRLLWITDSKYMSDQELLKENITNSLRDAAQWGPVYFNQLKDKIFKAIEEIYPDADVRRGVLRPITYGGEEYKWIQTCKGVGDMRNDPIMSDVFGSY